MRTPLAKAMDLYNLVTGKIKYDHNNKTVTLGRMYRRDGSYYDPAPYPIDDDEIEKIKQCIELAGGTDYMSPVTTREDAIARKIPVYISPDPCKYGHVGLKTITGKCYFCRESSDSPRQQAIRAGQKWYMPIDPCLWCGKHSPKRVQDSLCSSCVDSKSIQWIIENQDMIITREMARTLGIDVYQEDATGWKWVSTGNCVSCIK